MFNVVLKIKDTCLSVIFQKKNPIFQLFSTWLWSFLNAVNYFCFFASSHSCQRHYNRNSKKETIFFNDCSIPNLEYWPQWNAIKCSLKHSEFTSMWEKIHLGRLININAYLSINFFCVCSKKICLFTKLNESVRKDRHLSVIE